MIFIRSFLDFYGYFFLTWVETFSRNKKKGVQAFFGGFGTCCYLSLFYLAIINIMPWLSDFSLNILFLEVFFKRRLLTKKSQQFIA